MEKWAEGITAIRETADLGESPAAVDRETGVMYVNSKFKGKLDADQWYFIMLHELGHLKRKTRNELAADEWAHNVYLKEGRSLKKSVYALTDLLPGTRPEDLQRVRNQLRRAEKADQKVNFTDMRDTSYTHSYKFYGTSKCDPDYSVYFIGNRKPAINSSFDRSKLEYLFKVDDVAGIAAIVTNAFGPSKQNADHTQVLFNQYMADPNNGRPKIFPTKAEMLAGNLAASDRQGINANYDENTGTWAPLNSDFRGAVTGYDAQGNILISTFKGSTERYNGNLGVKSAKVMAALSTPFYQVQNAVSTVTNAVSSASSQSVSTAKSAGSSVAANVSNAFSSASPTVWIITGIIGVLIIVAAIIVAKKS